MCIDGDIDTFFHIMKWMILAGLFVGGFAMVVSSFVKAGLRLWPVVIILAILIYLF